MHGDHLVGLFGSPEDRGPVRGVDRRQAQLGRVLREGDGLGPQAGRALDLLGGELRVPERNDHHRDEPPGVGAGEVLEDAVVPGLHAQVREQVKPAEVVVVTRREPTREEILQKFRDAIGLSGGEEFESDGQLEDSLSEEELREFRQGRGPAWEELQRRRRVRREEEKRLGF